MNYYKTTQGSYTASIGTSPGEVAITQDEYEEIISEINAHEEHPEENVSYHLMADLTWEKVITD